MKQILLLILIGPLLTHSHQVLHNRNGVEDNQIGYGLRGRDSKFGTKFRFLIYPDTKWCGPGNIANNISDLGKHAELDKCCRSHDLCDDIMAVGETKHNLTNDFYFTRLNCQCDQEFHKCLKTINDRDSNIVGTLYFDILLAECFKNEYPIIGCKQHVKIIDRVEKCTEYELDVHGDKLYQWFHGLNYN